MNEQAMQQLLAFLQQQMEASQQNMADLPQRAMQAGATPTQGSGGTILSPDPVRRVQQANEAWRERFPNVVEQAARVGMTPEALLASQGNTATNQWAQLGGVPGVDPEKLREMNRNARAYRQFAEAQRSGTNGVTREIPSTEWEPGVKYRVGNEGVGTIDSSGMMTITSPYGFGTSRRPGSQPASAPAPAPQTPAAPMTAGVSMPDIFGPNPIRSAVQSYMENAPEAFRQAVIPNAPRNTSVAPPTQGSNLRQDVIQGLSFVPNMLLGAGSTMAEGLGSIFGRQFDLPQVNLQSDFFSNLRNTFGGSPDASLQMDANAPFGFRWQQPQTNQSTTAGQQTQPPQQSPYAAQGMTPESRAQMPVTVGANERNPFNPAAPVQPNFFNQIPAYGQGQTTPMTQDQTRNMFMTEEEKKRRQQQQPMFAGR